ncbi:MAG: MATE family efflux transporter [Oscillospiraceae bacterium]|nr:MATE family efflux transporter [Oscillospiraceae bacterium]
MSASQASAQETRLANAPLGPLMVKLAVPSMLAQLVNILYNIVDRAFIGHIPEIGSVALTGVGLCSPILLFATAFAVFAGSGGAPLASIQLGAGDRDKAERIMGNSVTLLLVLSVVLTTFGQIFKVPFLYAFGASDATIGYAVEYLSVYLWGTVFVLISLGLNSFITCQGHSNTAMASVLIGAVLNVLLDPLFIFVLDMGVKGAALATILSQAVSAAWVVRFLCSPASGLHIRLKYLKPDFSIIRSTAALGVAPFVMEGTESLLVIVINSGLQTYGGDLYVGSFTILQSIMMLFTKPMLGISQGCQPIISYNYGAKNYCRVRRTAALMQRVCFTGTILACFGACFGTRYVARFFTPDQALVDLAAETGLIFFAGVWAFGLLYTYQSCFMGTGQARTSLFLALMRKVVLLMPLAILLPRVTGSVLGIYAAEAIADSCAGLLARYKYGQKRDTLLPLSEARDA